MSEASDKRRARFIIETELEGSILQEKKTCKVCSQEKNFPLDFSGYNGQTCKGCVSEKKQLRRLKNYPREMLRQAKQRASENGIPFNLTEDWIVIPQFCPALGTPIIIGDHWNSPSLDRLNPHEGYTPENTRVISHRANTIKNNASTQELILIARYLLRELAPKS